MNREVVAALEVFATQIAGLGCLRFAMEVGFVVVQCELLLGHKVAALAFQVLLV